MNYDSNEIYHYGKPRRSGRYPYGSGSRPFQGRTGIFGFGKKKKSKVAGNSNGDGKTAHSKGPDEKNQNAKKSKKSVKKMTDRELSTGIQRMKLEKDYNDLKSSTDSAAKKIIKSSIEQIGRNTLTNVGTQVLTTGAVYALNKGLASAFKSQNKKLGDSKLSDEDVSKLINEYKFYTNNKKGK